MRSVIAADIYFSGNHYLLLEYELRENASCSVALIRLVTGRRMYDRELYLLLLDVAKNNGSWKKATKLKGHLLARLSHTWSDAVGFTSSVRKKLELLELL